MAHSELQNYFDENPVEFEGRRARALIFAAPEKIVKKFEAPHGLDAVRSRNWEAVVLGKYQKGAEKLEGAVVPFEIAHGLQVKVSPRMARLLPAKFRDRILNACSLYEPRNFEHAVVQERTTEDETLQENLNRTLKDGDVESAKVLLSELTRFDHLLIRRGFFPSSTTPDHYIVEDNGTLKVRDLNTLTHSPSTVEETLADKAKAKALLDTNFGAYRRTFEAHLPKKEVDQALEEFRRELEKIYDPRIVQEMGKDRRLKIRTAGDQRPSLVAV